MSRQEFPRAVKAAAALRADGRCEGLVDGVRCGLKLQTGRFQYDHIVADSIGGKPTLDNCAVLCPRCHGEKTRKLDTPRAAKTKRQRDKHTGAMVSRRPLLGSKASGWKKPMSGPWERRT